MGSHGSHGHGPMVGALSRGQFAKIVFPIAVLILIFIAYSILVHIFSLNLDTKELPTDAILFCIFWFLLFASFFRGALTSPGLVQKGWYKRYPQMHKVLKEKFQIYKKQMQQQNQWMTRFKKNKNEKEEENDDDNDNEETRLIIKNDEKEKEEEEDVFP